MTLRMYQRIMSTEVKREPYLIHQTQCKEVFNQIVSVLISLVKDAAAQLTEFRLKLNEIKLMNSSFNKKLSKLKTNQFLDKFIIPTQLPPDNLTTNGLSNLDVLDQIDTSTSSKSNITPNNTNCDKKLKQCERHFSFFECYLSTIQESLSGFLIFNGSEPT